jgi:hypothetical protein
LSESEKIDAPNVGNQEKDRRYNMEPGLIEVPGTPYAMEMAKFNKPYQYRPFPKMVYRAERRNGKIACMESTPDRYDFRDDRTYMLAEESARVFTERCQLVVNDEREYARAMESGYRESPQEAIQHCHDREDAFSKEVAHRNYDDRNLSEKAKAEIAEAEAQAGEPLAVIAEKRRGRPRKDAAQA